MALARGTNKEFIVAREILYAAEKGTLGQEEARKRLIIFNLILFFTIFNIESII